VERHEKARASVESDKMKLEALAGTKPEPRTELRPHAEPARTGLFCPAHRQSSDANAACFDYDDAAKLDGLFNGCEVGNEKLELLGGFFRAPSKQDDRGLPFIA